MKTLLAQLEEGFEPNSVAANHRLAGARIALRYATVAMLKGDVEGEMSYTDFLSRLCYELSLVVRS